MMSSREKNMVKVLVIDSTIVFFDRQFGALETGYSTAGTAGIQS